MKQRESSTMISVCD